MKTFTLTIEQQDIDKARECFSPFQIGTLSKNCIIAQAAKRQLIHNLHGKFVSMGYKQMHVKLPNNDSCTVFTCEDPLCFMIADIAINQLINKDSIIIKGLEKQLPLTLTFDLWKTHLNG